MPVEVTGSHGSPGRSAMVEYRRRRALELAGWTRSLAWRAPLVAATGVAVQILVAQAGLPRAGLLGMAVAALVGWPLRFRPSEQARTWQRGAAGERHTARLLDRLTRDGYVIFHDLAVPDSPANVDHLVIGPTGVFVIDSKQWTGSVQQGADGLAWHNHYPLDRTLETVRCEAQTTGASSVRPSDCTQPASATGHRRAGWSTVEMTRSRATRRAIRQDSRPLIRLDALACHQRHPVRLGQLAVFGPGEVVTASADARQERRSPQLDVLMLGGLLIREPVAAYGPFVMNTRTELIQAFEDYQAGRLGTIPAVPVEPRPGHEVLQDTTEPA